MNEIVATVNGQPIRRIDLENTVQGFSLERYRKTADQLSADEASELEAMALEKLLARELIFQEAMAAGVVADEAAIDAEKQKIIANFPSEEEFYATLEKAGIDAMMYHRMLRQDLTVNLMSQRQLADLAEPDESQVRELFASRSSQMLRKGRVRASHLLVKVKDGDKAAALATVRSLQDEATKGDFAVLARAHSACPSATGGGDLGWFRRGDMVKPFEEAAYSQPIGVVGAPVETQFGYHLIQVTEREEDVPLTFEEARPQIVELLRHQSGSKRIANWVEELKSRAIIDINPV